MYIQKDMKAQMQEVIGKISTDLTLSADSASYIEELYEQYLLAPETLSEDWQRYFGQFPQGDQPHGPIKQQFLDLARNEHRVQNIEKTEVSPEQQLRQIAVIKLIAAYRHRGHQKSKLDPLGLAKREHVAELELATHGLTQAVLATFFFTDDLAIGKPQASLKEIIQHLENTYCQSIGAEFTHLINTQEQRWLQRRLEQTQNRFNFSVEKKKQIFHLLNKAEGLEKYLANKFVGAKRFGAEGAETLVPLMHEIIQRAGATGTKEIALGMCHRGRLNQLVNIFGKHPNEMFAEFEGKLFTNSGSGDVKYHQGYSSNVMTDGGEVHLALQPNPSHLEIVSPVAVGSARARQDRRQNVDEVLSVSVHGDAAFAGQGVVMEAFQMSQTRAYYVGGTLHVIVNNQVGFTTSNILDTRSTEYCTDVAKTVQAPILHVNADDPEAAIYAIQLAHDYRKEFRKDIVVDLYCYRRRGHNEADEPSGTQPLMYQVVNQLPTTRNLYLNQLINEKILTQAEADQMLREYRDRLDAGQHVTENLVLNPDQSMYIDWTPYIGLSYSDECDSTFDLNRLKQLGVILNTVPEGFVLQRQVQKAVDDRLAMQTGELALNWGAAENLAYATLIDQDYPVRITGEDVGRGTFSHRHAKLHHQVDGSTYIPHCHIKQNQPNFALYDSLLTEEAVLAFEFGYATTTPKSLVVWEAQFGDFANCAQVVIDQFIASSETKWERNCGLTLLLPHGFEGQGPEHSSARLERFLQLCGEDNMQVITPTTPAQIFHVLRRQALRNIRKPMIVMSPKSLLRHKHATSTLDELATGTFQTVIDEIDHIQAEQVTRVVLCAGKVYYDLLEKRREQQLEHVALVRIEQLYPYPEARLTEVLRRYPNLQQLIWAQEEPENQGAWLFIALRLYKLMAKLGKIVDVQYAGRETAAAPACGSPYLHAKQQTELVQQALGL
ncbi:MAG TPA: 2-oxoglutarate dehydrogenase E1 component [Acinetobacter ursingii]|nr:2-oxoglutarate dehydrogenase E1 component [Acinetobacter ursingii]